MTTQSQDIEIGDFVECVIYIEASNLTTETNSMGVVQTKSNGDGLRELDFAGVVVNIKGDYMTIIGSSGSSFGVHKNKVVNVRKGVKV